ncbi:MAG: Rrf2 family transcriptional regulator [Phycisphaerae bacterium]|jgi:Rrf2 family protein
MKISRSTGYALLALGYIAKNQDQKIILSQTISKEYDIPLEYLLKIMQQMVRAGILRSKRGPRGGFSIAQQPKKISMLQVVEAVDGPMSSQQSLFETNVKSKFTNKIEAVYSKAISQAKAVLDKTKMSDLIA